MAALERKDDNSLRKVGNGWSKERDGCPIDVEDCSVLTRVL